MNRNKSQSDLEISIAAAAESIRRNRRVVFFDMYGGYSPDFVGISGGFYRIGNEWQKVRRETFPIEMDLAAFDTLPAGEIVSGVAGAIERLARNHGGEWRIENFREKLKSPERAEVFAAVEAVAIYNKHRDGLIIADLLAAARLLDRVTGPGRLRELAEGILKAGEKCISHISLEEFFRKILRIIGGRKYLIEILLNSPLSDHWRGEMKIGGFRTSEQTVWQILANSGLAHSPHKKSEEYSGGVSPEIFVHRMLSMPVPPRDQARLASAEGDETDADKVDRVSLEEILLRLLIASG